MSKRRQKIADKNRTPFKTACSELASRLTPNERRTLLLAASLFLLGFLVRWCRSANL